jgi:Carboxypeptidase regulatory-like domain
MKNTRTVRQRKPRKLFLNLIVTLLSLAAPMAAMSQGFGSIQGSVADGSGAVISGAVVTATQTRTGTVTVVNANGNGFYVFPSLPPAEYSISVTAIGFEKFVKNGVVLQADQSATVNFALRVGEASQTVTVVSNAAQVDTSTGTLETVIDTAQVNELPLNGRNAAQLTLLAPGVVAAPNDGADQGQTKTFPVVVTVSANGSQANQTAYLLDGGNNIDEYTNVNQPFPFPDALQEFSVQTSNYNAEYGQNAGAVVNIITKSGGQRFHGNAFEFLRNAVFNARNYFSSTVDPLKRNQFGGTIGGPVMIPHLVSGAHTFFFFGTQKTIIHTLQGGKTAFVPTQANLRGDFSSLNSATDPNNPLGKVIQIVNPFTGVPYHNNQIPVASFDPAALAFEEDLPSATGNGQISFQQPIQQSYLEFVARVDHDLGTKDHLSAHYYTNDFVNAGILDLTNLLTYSDQVDIRVQSALLSDMHTFNPNLFNSLIVNYSREVAARGPLANAPSVGDYGVDISLPPQKSLQSIAATGFFSVGDNPQAVFQRNNYTLADDFRWVKGNHNMAFGVHAEISKVDIDSLSNQGGTFTFNSNLSQFALASFLLGQMGQFGQGNGQYYNARNHPLGLYGQDSWKVSRRLTVNYGIRYEPYYPWHDLEDRMQQFNPAAYTAGRVSTVYVNAPKGLLFPGDAGMPRDGIRSIYTHVMPRVGFAYDVFGDGKTSLRGGGGQFYNSREPAAGNVVFTTVTPFSVLVALTNPTGTFSHPYTGIVNPFPSPLPAPKNIVFPSPVRAYTYDPSGHYQVPVTYDWNLTVEQEFARSIVGRIAYVGSHSSHNSTDIELNPAVYIPGSTLGTDARRGYAGYSNISLDGMGGNGSYNSLQATLQKRSSRGFSFLVNYTFSKALDNLPYGTHADIGNVNVSYVYPISMANYKSLDKGPSDFDSRNVLSASYVARLPKLASGNRLVRMIVNDWQSSSVFQAHSGNPLTVLAGSDRSQTGLLQDRAVLTGKAVYGAGACLNPTIPCKNYLNPAAFALPAIGGFGNVQKSSLVAPGYFTWDTSLVRYFPIKGEAQIQFRAEYFDLLNRANFGAPVNSVSSGGFGSITSANTSRIAQLSLKISF